MADPAYEAVLHVLAATNQANAGEPVPQSLSALSRQLRNDLGTGNLRLVNTYVGRLSGMGSLEYKGVSNAYANEPETGNPSFLDWRLMNMKPLQNTTGQNVFQFDTFRFGARVPIKMGHRDEGGKSVAPINYEAIGLTLNRMSIRENVPTLVGTLTQPKTDGTLFIVLTVKNVDR